MTRKAFLLLLLLPLLSACGEPPIKQANCWNRMAFIAAPDCALAR
ncbi:hypothetical protein RM190_22720 [Paracoccus sp. CPCC 101403]|uniref:Uncharacterized protein n=1 Tax=Paracoccus broussonetiae TaxID=3075834 RepID=A0ABU3ELQ5_9RHOB|nr:hypothetical protein [Paracoccus sp. CPCC 101403]MDT1064687.1 hypothetical protein [Paracoccus sp. CPCC 101403]